MLVTIWTVGQYRVLICSPRFFRFTDYEAVTCFGRVRPQGGPCRLPKASAFGVSCFLCKTTDQVKKIPGPSIFLNLDSSSTHTFTPNSPVRNLNVEPCATAADNLWAPPLTFADLQFGTAPWPPPPPPIICRGPPPMPLLLCTYFVAVFDD